MNLKLDDGTLLTLALNKLKTSRRQWIQATQRKLDWDSLKYVGTQRKTYRSINPTTGEQHYSDEQLWETTTHLIKTTQHGRIIDIEEKPRSIIKPTIIQKKRRSYQK